MRNRILVINGVRSDSFGFKVNVNDFDRITPSQSASTVSEYGIYKKDTKRLIVKTNYSIDIPKATVEKIDVIKRWLTQENVPFSDYSLDRECTAYKIVITDSNRMIKNYYTINFTVEKSSVYYAKEVKTVTNNGATLTVEYTKGTVETAPRFSFTASSALKVIALSHPNGKVFQIGNNDAQTPIIPAGSAVTIDMANGKVLIGGNRRIYATGLSEEFTLGIGTTRLGISVQPISAPIPRITMSYREAFL